MKLKLFVLFLGLTTSFLGAVSSFAGGDTSPFEGYFEGTHTLQISMGISDTVGASLLVEKQGEKLVGTLVWEKGDLIVRGREPLIKGGKKKSEVKIVEKDGRSGLQVGPFYFKLEGDSLAAFKLEGGGRAMSWNLRRVVNKK